jgi:hypothetical protein
MASQGPRVALLVYIGLLGLWFLRALVIRLRLAAGRKSAWALHRNIGRPGARLP